MPPPPPQHIRLLIPRAAACACASGWHRARLQVCLGLAGQGRAGVGGGKGDTEHAYRCVQGWLGRGWRRKGMAQGTSSREKMVWLAVREGRGSTEHTRWKWWGWQWGKQSDSTRLNLCCHAPVLQCPGLQ